MPNRPRTQLRLALALFCRVPSAPPTEPVNPRASFFFVIILIIPALPSASYFAVGVVTTSTSLIWSAGMAFSALATSDEKSVEGFPLMSICIFDEPRRLTLPSKSTDSNGTRLNTSDASPPRFDISLSALYTNLSIRFSTNAASPTTSISSSN